MSETKLAVVVPCYNPHEGWSENLINSFQQFIESIGEHCHLILVNDGTSEGISDNDINSIKAAFPDMIYESYQTNRGKGYALRAGIGHAEEPYVILTDIDFPYTIQSMVDIYDKVKQQAGLVLGHRQRSYYQKVPLFRKWLSVAFRLSLKIFLKLQVDDTQCGLKAMGPRAKAVFMETKIDGYLYDLELVRLTEKRRLPISHVNVFLKNNIAFSNMSPGILLKESSNFLKILRSR